MAAIHKLDLNANTRIIGQIMSRLLRARAWELLRCGLKPGRPISSDLCANVAPRNPPRENRSPIIMRKQFLGCILMLLVD